jgi:hypothetical protein
MVWVVVAEGVAIALLAVLVLGLLRSHALILRALHELGAGLELEKEAGSPGPVPVSIEGGAALPAPRPGAGAAHDVVGTDLAGHHTVVDVAGDRAPTVLLAFLTSGCSLCRTFWAELGPDTALPAGARLVVVVKGAGEESPAALASLARPGVPVVVSDAAWVDYEVPGSPYFVLVEGGAVTGEGSAETWPGVRDLLEQAVAEAADARRAPRSDGGPGEAAAPGGRDDLGRIDRELLAAGIHPGHASLYLPPDGPEGVEDAGEAR